MERKLNSILLVDDDEPTNFLNKNMLEDMQCANSIKVIQKATDALEYLRQMADREDWSNFPDLVFLDINMPAMDGWEFLAAYRNIDKKDKPVSLIMLTTSLNPEDEQKALDSAEVTDYKSKPLTHEMVTEILSGL